MLIIQGENWANKGGNADKLDFITCMNKDGLVRDESKTKPC